MANPAPIDPNSPHSPPEDSRPKPVNPFYSPLDDIQGPRSPRPSGASKPATLRRLDGSPYDPSTNGRTVLVAEDMYDGQNPPEYKRQASYTNLKSAEPADLSTNNTNCRACTPPRTEHALDSATSHPRHGCNKCGKKKVAPPATTPAQNLPMQQRPTSMEGITALSRPQPQQRASIAPLGAVRKTCHKCGKAKRPTVTALAQAVPSESTAESSRSTTPLPRGHIASQHIMFSPDRPSGLRITCDVPLRKPVANRLDHETGAAIDIDVIPPTATSERPPQNELTDSNIEGSPLLEGKRRGSSQHVHRTTSVSSITSSIGRSLSKSRRRKSNDPDASSPNLPADNENGAGRLINMLASAIRGNESQEYARLGEPEKRPGSPFSFVEETAVGGNAYEMDEMTGYKPESRDPWDRPNDSFVLSGPFEPVRVGHDDLPKRPETLRVRPVDAESKFGTPLVTETDTFLGDPNQQPGIARFKSLRQGVTRASSVARAGSLKRLNSLKNAPQFWYRTDMAIEGASVAC